MKNLTEVVCNSFAFNCLKIFYEQEKQKEKNTE